MAALKSVLPPILHCPLFCPHALIVTAWLTTFSISQQTRQRTTKKLELGWTEISTYLSTLTNKDIVTIFCALQPSPSWFSYSTKNRQACFKAASHPESGVRLDCIRNNRIGNLIDNDTLRIGIALRVGFSVCIPHRSKCGMTVDASGTRPLPCRFSAARIPRHSTLSGVVRRDLSAARIRSMLEPSRLDRSDGKRPDGITVCPYSCGRCLI